MVLCQEKTLEFYPLKAVDTIQTNCLTSLLKIDELKNTRYFFTETYMAVYDLFLVKKVAGNWVVYTFDLNLNFGTNTSIKNIKKENNQFISIRVMRTPSGTCTSIYEITILLDIAKIEFTDFFSYSKFDCFDGNVTDCKATFSMQENKLEIKSSKTKDDGLSCIESGDYNYENGKFIRIK
jgi:hypothetical protein